MNKSLKFFFVLLISAMFSIFIVFKQLYFLLFSIFLSCICHICLYYYCGQRLKKYFGGQNSAILIFADGGGALFLALGPFKDLWNPVGFFNLGCVSFFSFSSDFPFLTQRLFLTLGVVRYSEAQMKGHREKTKRTKHSFFKIKSFQNFDFLLFLIERISHRKPLLQFVFDAHIY